MASIFETHVYPVLGARPIEQIVHSEVQLLLNNIAKNKNAGESTLKKVPNASRAVFEMAINDNRLLRNPAMKLQLPDCKQPDHTFYTLVQLQALLAAARKRSLRDYIYLLIFMVWGLRPGECVALRVDDVGENELRIDEMLTRVKNPRKKNLSTEELAARKSDKTLPGIKNTLKTLNSIAPVPMTELMTGKSRTT